MLKNSDNDWGIGLPRNGAWLPRPWTRLDRMPQSGAIRLIGGAAAARLTSMLSPEVGTDLRTYLQNEFTHRKSSNPGYSLRAFARILKIDHSTLSQIMRGKRDLSSERVEKLGMAIGLPPDVIQGFKDKQFPGVRLSREPSKKNAPGVPDPNQLLLDVYHIVAEWYHYAILELMKVQGFESKPEWVAKKLGISTMEVRVAFERLVRVGFIQVGTSGAWTPGRPVASPTGNPYVASAYERQQRRAIEASLDAFDKVPGDRREYGSMTIAINTKRLPEIREKLTRFRRELNELLRKDNERDAVYQLGISFHPLGR